MTSRDPPGVVTDASPRDPPGATRTSFNTKGAQEPVVVATFVKKSKDSKLGISVENFSCGGKLMISNVEPGAVVATTTNLRPGMELLFINGISTAGMTPKDVVTILKESKPGMLSIVAADISQTVTATVRKPNASSPIGVAVSRLPACGRNVITQIRHDGLLCKTSLKVGMEILYVNDVNVVGVDASAVTSIMKNTKDELTIVAREVSTPKTPTSPSNRQVIQQQQQQQQLTLTKKQASPSVSSSQQPPFGCWEGKPSNALLRMTLGGKWRMELRPDGVYKWSNGLLSEKGRYRFTRNGGFFNTERSTGITGKSVVVQYTGNSIVFYNKDIGMVKYNRVAGAVKGSGGSNGTSGQNNSLPQYFIPVPISSPSTNPASALQMASKLYNRLSDSGLLDPLGEAVGEAVGGAIGEAVGEAVIGEVVGGAIGETMFGLLLG